jgi:hypothetical protein
MCRLTLITFLTLALFVCVQAQNDISEPKDIIPKDTLFVDSIEPDGEIIYLDTVIFQAAIKVIEDTINDSTIVSDTVLFYKELKAPSLPKPDKLKDTVIIAGVGDIMPGTDFPSKKYLPSGNHCFSLLEEVRDTLLYPDVLFGNLEGVFAGSVGEVKKCKDTLNCYAFRIPDHYLECITDAGFDLLSVANNHVGDFGYQGRERTAQILEKNNVAFSGFMTHPYAVFRKDGLKYGFIAFSTSPGTNNFNDYRRAKYMIQNLKDTVDFVIVSFHGGAEGRKYQRVPKKRETFYGQDRGNVYEFAHLAVDAGADVVYGHGPHVTRAMEVYENKLICYSLGNFSTYARFNISGPNGIAPLVYAYFSRDGKFLKARIISTRQNAQGKTVFDPSNRAYLKLKDLTNMDFPENDLIFTEDNEIIPADRQKQK